MADLTTAIFKLNNVAFITFNDGVTLRAIQADVADTVFYVVFMPALCNGRSDVHAFEIIQT